MQRGEDNCYLLWPCESNWQPLCWGSGGHRQDPEKDEKKDKKNQRFFFLPLPLRPAADLTLLDEHGNKTAVPNKERQVEALQLLLLLLPPANRSLLKLLLDLLHHTARQQERNKMSAFNLALMFAPHVLWPRHVRPSGDLERATFTLRLRSFTQELFFFLPDLWSRWRPLTWRTTWRSSTTPWPSSSNTPRRSLGWLFCCTHTHMHTHTTE